MFGGKIFELFVVLGILMVCFMGGLGVVVWLKWGGIGKSFD